MKKITFNLLLIFIGTTSSVFAQNDTMYVMKSGEIVGKFNVNTEIDSIIFYNPSVTQDDTQGNFTDSRDGNTYNWVKIGEQVWMAENLAYLPSVNQPTEGSENVSGFYYYVSGYNGTDVSEAKATENYKTYGVLYNWTAAMNNTTSSTNNPSGVQGACPAGWHLPSDAEWTQLTDFLEGKSVAGGKLKETGTAHWPAPNTGATNETGFSALPGGNRDLNGFFNLGYFGIWWSATEYDTVDVWFRFITYSYVKVDRSTSDKDYGRSVRCVKD